MKLTRRLIPAVGAMALVAVLLAPSIATAANEAQIYDLKFEGSVSKNLLTIDPQVCDDCIPDIFLDDPDRTGEWFGLGAEASIDTELEWKADATDTLSYNDTLLKQGQTLDTSNTLVTGPGTVDVSFTVSGTFGIYESHPDHGPYGEVWVPTSASVSKTAKVLAVSIPCVMPLPGESPRTCTSAPTEVTVFSLPVVPTVSVTFGLQFSLSVTVTGSGIVTLRSADVVGGTNVANGPITFQPASPAVVADPMFIPCSQPEGGDFTYALSNNSYTAETDLSLNIAPTIGVELDVFPDPDPWVIHTFNIPLFEYPTLNMTAPNISKNLGPIAADNVPPVANPGGTGATHLYDNKLEGVAVQFDGSASSDNCGFPTLRWDFSDGGVAYGPSPQHTFADNGTYTGLLTATDVIGNVSTSTFTVNVGNQTPLAAAGPAGSGAWGRLVQFNGAGTDPGAGDQPTLTYAWDFGDGSPSATGGPNVVHAYNTPDTYVATLTVCDKNGACDTDTRSVVVRKRATSIGATGPTTGTFSTPTTLSASLVDEFGQAVNGRSVTMAVGTDPSVFSVTNSAGAASAGYTPGLGEGTYDLNVAFATDSLYTGSANTSAFGIAKKATTTTYTGATTGAPNKIVVLSAKLVDATGTALSGRTISFQLGTQSTSATTDANGNASTTLKLAQKNGTYTVSATWTPNVADGSKYVASGDAKVFKLQAK